MTIDRFENWRKQPTNQELIKSSPIDVMRINFINYLCWGRTDMCWNILFRTKLCAENEIFQSMHMNCKKNLWLPKIIVMTIKFQCQRVQGWRKRQSQWGRLWSMRSFNSFTAISRPICGSHGYESTMLWYHAKKLREDVNGEH